jgi:hypothetical protein
MKIYTVITVEGYPVVNLSTGVRFYTRKSDALKLRDKYLYTKDVKKVLEYDLSQITPLEIKEEI